jgi:hypothetical protein
VVSTLKEDRTLPEAGSHLNIISLPLSLHDTQMYEPSYVTPYGFWAGEGHDETMDISAKAAPAAATAAAKTKERFNIISTSLTLLCTSPEVKNYK